MNDIVEYMLATIQGIMRLPDLSEEKVKEFLILSMLAIVAIIGFLFFFK